MGEDISDVLYQHRHKKAEIEEQIRWRTPLWKSSGGQRAVHRSISTASSTGVREAARDAGVGSFPDSNYPRSISQSYILSGGAAYRTSQRQDSRSGVADKTASNDK